MAPKAKPNKAASSASQRVKPPPALLLKKEDSDARLKAMIVYVSKKCQDDPNFGATKLNKILFYADFESFRVRGKPITGAEYFRLEFGPAPKRLKPLMEELIHERSVAIMVNEVSEGMIQKKPIALKDPELDELFTAEDISLVDIVISKCKEMNASQLSKFSHQKVAWRIMANEESIPYALVHVSDASPTQEDIDRTEELALEHGW